MLTFFIRLLSLAITFSVATVSPADEKSAAEKPKVITSIRPLALIADALAGEYIDTRVLIENAASPHDFSMTIAQGILLQDGDLLLWVGPRFESFLENLPRLPQTVAMFDDVDERQSQDSDHRHHHSDDHSDLHLWLSTEMVAAYASRVTAALQQLLPGKSAEISANLNEFTSLLNVLDEEIARSLAPFRAQGYVAFHDAYGVFSERYKLNELTSLTRVPRERLSAKKLAQISAQAKGAACLITEQAETRQAQRYGNLLELNVVTVDLLATQPGIESFGDYLLSVRDAFLECLERKNPVGR